MTDVAQTHDTRTLEALLFVSDEPLTPAVLSQAMELDRRVVESLCDRLQAELEARGSGLVLRNVAGGWRLFTHPDTQPIVERFVLSSRQARLTKAALETLGIVAYKQPATRHQVSAIRGVNSDGVLRALVDRGLIEEAGRDEGPGRAVLSTRRRLSSSSDSGSRRSRRCPRSRRCWMRTSISKTPPIGSSTPPRGRSSARSPRRRRPPRGGLAGCPKSASSGRSPARGSGRVDPARN